MLGEQPPPPTWTKIQNPHWAKRDLVPAFVYLHMHIQNCIFVMWACHCLALAMLISSVLPEHRTEPNLLQKVHVNFSTGFLYHVNL